jgi:multidrug transporter EmrE-like cation transporter
VRRAVPALLLSVCIMCQVTSVILLKNAANSLGAFSILHVVQNPFYLASLFVLGVQAVIWPFVLRRLPLFVVYSGMALAYPGILLVGFLVFHEPVRAGNLVGTALIVLGVVVFMAGREKSNA